MHPLVTPTLDFGNAALFGITGTLLHRLEMVKRAAPRVVLCIDRRDHRGMTAALRELHWLPIAKRIQFKVLTLMHGAVHNRTPRYLSDRIVTHAPSRSLLSATKSLFAVLTLGTLRQAIFLVRGSLPVECASVRAANPTRPCPL